jgi:hypothetical protein
MSVAPSFQKYPTFGEPYEKNKRKYIVIVYPDGHHREVRWYDTEPAAAPSKTSELKKIRSTKDVLGFSKGYITIFKGDTYPVLEWFQREPNCRYHNYFGWYVISEEEIPENVPAGIEPIQLKWEDVAFADEDQLRPESQIKEHIDSLMYEPSSSKWQGEVGDRLEKALTVTKVIPIEGYYGNSTMHIFSDPEENVYVWTTAAKTLEVGKTYIIRGTVKEHKSFKNVPQTILTRCNIK